MAEVETAVVDEAAAVTDPGDRGSLEVRDRAIEHLVEAAVLTTPGVQRHGRALSNLVGHDLPRVDAVVAGDRVRTAVEIAAEWGRPLAALSADARNRITTALRDHAGLTVDSVTVHVAAIVPPSSERRVS
ncbi:Asp23/Gls24 family envelope stress response protein [Mycolicibacterium sp. 3033]|nr:Asp23/Gls24 family envelope stress response protein [Mycolicibacterium aurantiacum]